MIDDLFVLTKGVVEVDFSNLGVVLREVFAMKEGGSASCECRYNRAIATHAPVHTLKWVS